MGFSITAEVLIEDVVEAILSSSEVDVFSLILELDEAEADEDFSLRLIGKLAESLYKEYQQSEEYAAARCLKYVSGEELNTPSRDRYSNEWEESFSRKEKMKQIMNTISDLLSGENDNEEALCL